MSFSITAAVLGIGLGTASLIENNQATQHAKGAAQAQQTAANAAQAQATAIGPAQTASATLNNAPALAAAARKRQLAMAAGMMSTIGPNGMQPQPASLVSQPQAFATGMKTALGA